MEYQRRFGNHVAWTSALTVIQILSITCDNTSVNDVMIEELAKAIPNFLGAETRIHCFLHILNLVAKTIIKVFNVPKGKKGPDDMSDAETFLSRLAEGIEQEEQETRASRDDDGEADDDVENLVEETKLLSEEEKKSFEAGVLPIRLVITKVSRFQSGERALILT